MKKFYKFTKKMAESFYLEKNIKKKSDAKINLERSFAGILIWLVKIQVGISF